MDIAAEIARITRFDDEADSGSKLTALEKEDSIRAVPNESP